MEYFFKRKIEEYQIGELQKRLPFLCEDKIDYRINYQDDLAYSITIFSVLETRIDELSKMLDYLLEDIYKIENIPSKIAWEKEYYPSKSNLQEIFDSGYVY